MATNKDYLAYILEQLKGMGIVDSKPMFGGTGLFFEGRMFGMIAHDKFRLKVGPENQSQFESVGMEPFHIKKGAKPLPYWEVPVEVLEDQEELASWALQSYTLAVKNKRK